MAFINYIIKKDFFLAFKTVYFKAIIINNIRAGFRKIGLIFYNLNIIIFKLNIKL